MRETEKTGRTNKNIIESEISLKKIKHEIPYTCAYNISDKNREEIHDRSKI